VNNLKGQFRKAVQDVEGPYLVAVSGGVDSMALLNFMMDDRREIVVAHFDHRLRPESGKDAGFVRGFCLANGVRCEIGIAGAMSGNVENAARMQRYKFLLETAEKYGCNTILTAHHLDDQAETIFLNICRGTGLNGLKGIAKRKPLGSKIIYRPLLDFRKEDLKAYLNNIKVEWIEDPTNVDGNARAKIRHKIFPLIQELLDRDPMKPLARLSENVAEISNNLNIIDEMAEAFIHKDEHWVKILDGWKHLPETVKIRAAAMAIRHVRKENQDPNKAEIERLIEWIESGTPSGAIRSVEVFFDTYATYICSDTII